MSACYFYYIIVVTQSMIQRFDSDEALNDLWLSNFITGPETRTQKTPNNDNFAIYANPNIGWFSVGITLEDATGWFSTTNSHNLCQNPTNLTSHNGKLLSTSYNYSTTTECARFYWANQTHGELLANKTGIIGGNMTDFTGYKVYLNPPIGYEVQKYGASTRYTSGLIDMTVFASKGQFIKSCNATYNYSKLYYVVDKSNNEFDSEGHCGSIVYNKQDKFIIGIAAAGVSLPGKTYTVVVPFSYCYDGFFETYTRSEARTSTSMWLWIGIGISVIVSITLLISWVRKHYYVIVKRKKSDDPPENEPFLQEVM